MPSIDWNQCGIVIIHVIPIVIHLIDVNVLIAEEMYKVLFPLRVQKLIGLTLTFNKKREWFLAHNNINKTF